MRSTSPPLVSVILPAYNHEKYLEDCIRSVINQTYANIELLVIDDGSPDASWSVICSLKSISEHRFTRVFFDTQPNVGLCVTYNRLIEKAEGKYIFILNSDDVTKPEAIAALVEFLENNVGYAAAVGNNDLIDGEGKKIWWNLQRQVVPQEQEGAFETFKDFYGNMPKGKCIDFTSSEFGTYDTLIKRGNHIPNGYLILKDIFEKTGSYSDEAPIEDYFIFLQISKFSKIGYIDSVLHSYRWHGDNTICLRDTKYRYKDRTLRYEKAIVDAFPEECIRQSYYDYINKKRIIFRFGSLVCFYKIKNFMCKKYILQVFGREFVLYCKGRSIID